MGGETTKRYIYRKDNGELIEVPWEVMITQQDGFITLEDGSLARRCIYLETERDSKGGKPTREPRDYAGKEIVSDALGFGQHQLEEFEEDRKRNGFSGVEFTRDPMVPEFLQVRCRSRDEFNRYVKHRGMVNNNTFGGVRLSQEDLDRAKELVERVHGGGDG